MRRFPYFMAVLLLLGACAEQGQFSHASTQSSPRRTVEDSRAVVAFQQGIQRRYEAAIGIYDYTFVVQDQLVEYEDGQLSTEELREKSTDTLNAARRELAQARRDLRDNSMRPPAVSDLALAQIMASGPSMTEHILNTTEAALDNVEGQVASVIAGDEVSAAAGDVRQIRLTSQLLDIENSYLEVVEGLMNPDEVDRWVTRSTIESNQALQGVLDLLGDTFEGRDIELSHYSARSREALALADDALDEADRSNATFKSRVKRIVAQVGPDRGKDVIAWLRAHAEANDDMIETERKIVRHIGTFVDRIEELFELAIDGGPGDLEAALPEMLMILSQIGGDIGALVERRLEISSERLAAQGSIIEGLAR